MSPMLMKFTTTTSKKMFLFVASGKDNNELIKMIPKSLYIHVSKHDGGGNKSDWRKVEFNKWLTEEYIDIQDHLQYPNTKDVQDWKCFLH